MITFFKKTNFALFIFLIEINLSSKALKTHLEDLEEKK